MDNEKIFDAGKKENQPQEKSSDELLSETELAKVAGGVRESVRKKNWYDPPGDAGSNGH